MTEFELTGKTTTKHGITCGLILVVVMVGSWLLHGDIRTTSEFSLPMDHHKYLAMAEGPIGSFHVAPFCWRIAVPAAARLLQGVISPFTMFLAIGILCVVVTGILIGIEVLEVTRSSSLSIAAVLLYSSLGWITRGFSFYGASVDPAAILIGLLVYRAARKENFNMLIAVGCLGALVKESVLISVVVALILQGRDMAWWKKIAAFMLPLSVLVIVRNVIPAWNSDTSYINGLPEAQSVVQYGSSRYDVQYLLHVAIPQRLNTFSLTDVNAMTFDSFGVGIFVLLVMVARSEKRRFFLSAFVVLLAWSQILVAANIQRPVLLVAPVLICSLFASRALQDFRRSTVLSGIAVMTLLVICVVAESRISPNVFVQFLFVGAFFVMRYVLSVQRVRS